jgi:CubicO group peptidase (beta-lactamase class C family)
MKARKGYAMNTKKLLYGSLVVGGLWAGIRQLFARAASKEAVPSGSSYADIDDYLQKQARRLNLPGLCLAIVEGDQIVHMHRFTRQAGTPYDRGEPPSLQTPFAIGSITKSFTALAVMQLVEAGQVELDAPVQQYLPWFRAILPRSPRRAMRRAPELNAGARITVRHLLNQTSGLPLLPGWQQTSDFDDRPGATLRQAQAFSPYKLNHPPGDAFEYSNLNFNLLGLIIEAVSGETYADYVQRHIFEPLGMRHSHTSKAAALRDGMAVGNQSWFGIPIPASDLPMPSGSLPSGQLISSAEDMCHYLIAHLNGGRFGEAQILSPAGIAELHCPAAETSMLNGEKGWYGMGWYIEERGKVKILSHSGLVPDYFAYMALLPEQKKGLILLVNGDHFTMQITMSEVDAGLTNLLAGKPPEPLRLGAVPWVQRGLLFIPILQIVDVIATLGILRRWQSHPQSRPERGRLWVLHILLPLIPNLLAALTLIPATSKIRGFLLLFAPDFTWIGRICGSFASVWMFVRTGLLLRSQKK